METEGFNTPKSLEEQIKESRARDMASAEILKKVRSKEWLAFVEEAERKTREGVDAESAPLSPKEKAEYDFKHAAQILQSLNPNLFYSKVGDALRDILENIELPDADKHRIMSEEYQKAIHQK
jgi:hypothetical protein